MAGPVTSTLPTNLDDLLARLRDLLPELRTRYHVTSLAVFGSRTRDDAAPESDLDLLATFDPKASLFELTGMEQDLGDLVGIKVDIVTPSSIKPRLKERILSSAVPV